jgi:hypothetical protein
MAVTYAVAQRGGPFARWGFCLPMPPVPVRHPVFLPQSMRPLAETKMGEIFVGTFAAVANNWNLTMTRGIRIGGPAIANAGGGVWTGGISDCMVVCSAYFDVGPPRRWNWFCFQHVPGGEYQSIVQAIGAGLGQHAPVVANRYAVIASGNLSGVDLIDGALVQAGIPPGNICIYSSGTGARGFAFGIDISVGLFGELTHAGAQLPPNWPH